MTLRMSSKRTFGAASRSSPSLRWNSSRYSSGTRPTSRNDITWPSFIAAPFIVPSAATICSAASRWRRSSAACLPSSERARFVRRVPSWRAAWPAARVPTFAVRARREVGMRSLAIDPDIGRAPAAARRALRASASAWRWGRAWSWPPGARPLRRRRGRGGGGRRRRRGRRVAVGVADSSASRSRSASAWPSVVAGRLLGLAAAEERRTPVAARDGVAEDRQLRRGHDGRDGEEGDAGR